MSEHDVHVMLLYIQRAMYVALEHAVLQLTVSLLMYSVVRRVLAALKRMATSPDVKVSGNLRLSNRVSARSPPYTNERFTM